MAVEALKVKHVVVCGHYGCGGVTAALKNRASGKLKDLNCDLTPEEQLPALV